MLHQTISAIRAETWEQLNRALLTSAKQEKLESGCMVRLDSAVTAALVHEPSDSSLLWDAVRVMVRLLRAASAWVGEAGGMWRDHQRAAKKRARAIEFTRGRPRRVQLYRELEPARRRVRRVDPEMGAHVVVVGQVAPTAPTMRQLGVRLAP